MADRIMGYNKVADRIMGYDKVADRIMGYDKVADRIKKENRKAYMSSHALSTKEKAPGQQKVPYETNSME